MFQDFIYLFAHSPIEYGKFLNISILRIDGTLTFTTT